jgi:3-oxoacyl-[acyl-carrier-protein] synthase II
MRIFVTGISSISPQKTFSGLSALNEPIAYSGNTMACVEPDYLQWFNHQQLRRMSRILKIGTTTAMLALQDAGVKCPDAIITATGYGCLDDTGIFLTQLTVRKEEALNPTPFMQSTHNTIGAQIALLVQCTGYNQTFVHGAFAFEHALLDAMMHTAEQPDQHILVGAVDETTAISHAVQSRFNLYSQTIENTLSLFDHPGKGTIQGEGAAFFLLTGKESEKSKACIHAVKTLYNPDADTLTAQVDALLQANGLRPEDVDLLLLGKTGDYETDYFADDLAKGKFKQSSIGVFKHLCGEYTVSSSFGLWLAVSILNEQVVPPILVQQNANRIIKNILIYNPYFSKHHSFILVTACHPTRN